LLLRIVNPALRVHEKQLTRNGITLIYYRHHSKSKTGCLEKHEEDIGEVTVTLLKENSNREVTFKMHVHALQA